VEEQEFQHALPGFETEDVSKAAASRLLVELGSGIEGAQQWLGWRAGRDLYPYQVTIKRPLLVNQDYLVIVKALTADGPVIAFHGGYGYIQALIGMGKRGANGQLEFREDEMKPKNYDAWERERSYYVEKFG